MWERLALPVVVLAAVLWWGRRLPLEGLRKTVVIGLRALACALVILALWGFTRRATDVQPQHVLYLADASDSLDAQQRAWVARRIASLDARRPQAMRRAVAVFGGDLELVVPFDDEARLEPGALEAAMRAAPMARDRTDLERALVGAVGRFPSGRSGRVILLSDGRETTGNVGAILPQLHRLGLRVYPEAVPQFGAGTVAWESLVAPPVVQRGSSAGVQLVLSNGAAAPKAAQITVRLAGIVIKRARATLRPGWQVFTVAVPAIQQGRLAMDVEVRVPEDGLRERRQAYTQVEGPAHVLLVDPQPTDLPVLAQALRRREVEISVSRPQDLPTDPHAWLAYDAALFVGVPKSQLTDAQGAALRAYLERDGGGLVVVGLGEPLAREIQTASPLDAVLPVTYNAKGRQESRRRVAMVMLIDRSASMIGPRIAATKRAAVELVKQLEPEDLVGILTFDTKAYVVVDVQRAGDVGPQLIEKLVRLRSSGGTDVLPALRAAKARLDQSGATVKHVILLSDGNTPFPSDTYAALAAEFREGHVTVSSIGIGSAFINTDYLEWIAGSTGGTFYQLRSLEELPQLIAQDTQGALGRLPFAEGYFPVERAPAAEWFTDVPAWPSLKGFLTATAKPEARVELQVRAGEEPHPLLARWRVGNGRVAAFLSDAAPRWSPAWVRWPGFAAWAAQLIRWAMRPRLSEELFVRMETAGGASRLIVEGELRQPTARIIAPEGEPVIPLSLVQAGPWRWTAAMEHVPSGWYELTVESQVSAQPSEPGSAVAADGAAAVPVFTTRWIEVGAAPAVRAGEVHGQAPHDGLLRQLAHATAGRYGVADLAFIPPTTTTTWQEPLLTWWLPLVILLLLLEVMLRGASMLER